MDKKQTIVLILSFTVLFSVMAVLAYFYSGSGTQQRQDFDTTKRFKAKPGTTREKAMALSSNKRPTQTPTGTPKPSGEPPIPVKSLSPPDEKLSAEESRLREATNSLDPVKGMEMIDAELGMPQRAEHAARLHAARAQLALQRDPPDYAAAAADLARAAELAPTSVARYEYLVLDAGALFQQEAYDAAVTRIGAELEEPGPLSPARIKLRSMLAQAYELEGDLEEAEAMYRKVMREVITYSDDSEPETNDLLRVAVLRLSDILRETGRETEARDLARGYRARLRGEAEEEGSQSSWETSSTF